MTPTGARSDPVLRTRSLTKRYRSGTAVENLDLHLGRGRVYGLIGRNGAGKTTLMRMICGLVRPTGGEIELFGRPARPGRGPAQEDLRRLGCLIEAPGLQMRMSARANLHLHRIIRGIPSPTLEDELLGLVGLADAGDKRVGEFSLGMRQRLGIAIALVAGPELLILDEPVNGLDPVGVVEMRRLMVDLARERGTTILVSSHNLPELYQTATDYLIVDRGRLRRSLSHDELVEHCSRHLVLRCSDAPALVRALEEMDAGRLRVMADGAVRLLDPPPDREALVRGLVARDLVPTTIAEEGQSLEEYFLAVIGSGPRAQETARRGARTATTRSEPREEETHVQSAAR
ncbi:ATP-binding cassette domain-containing protein [Actinomyces dentalis]|uniref:ATP-binding cassette domain-containing protein n=1 Tax=Actinomyces dentalis TaxID=272548 RepID=UPI002352758D|nr:ATP-binding cassette domain-containing protein [Actinomyces dentalis]